MKKAITRYVAAAVLAVLAAAGSLEYRAVPVEAAHVVRLTNLAANTEANSICTLLNNGWIDIRDGSQPATADTAVTTQVLLASLRINATACGAASLGVATFNAITSDASADATGTASWARLYESDHTTAVYDGSVCTSGCDLNFATVSFVSGAVISISSMTFTAPKS
jgi:hypothetical protein